ncbi:MAG TPA: hypothetical protein PLR99_10350 [Polyangiaceae bacterium]|nr:hypothetical protein [Polyangiaceae bacterium]
MKRSRRDLLLAAAVAAAAGLASFALLRDRDARAPSAPSRTPAPPPAETAALFFGSSAADGGVSRGSEADAHHSIRALATPPERVPVSSARAPSLAGHSPGF